jgi:Tissue inhibitor of metalloproteinase
MRLLQIILVSFILAALYPLFACTCFSSSSCEAFGNSKAVFIGQVVSGKSPERMSDAFALKTNQLEFGFDVKTAYFGADPAEPITVSTGIGFGDCGFPFEKGETYLVYAYESDGKLKTSVCSRTKHYSRISEDEWDFLNSVANVKWSGGRVFGNVSIVKRRKDADSGTREITGPLARASLKLIDGRGAREIQTDENGNYLIDGLAAEKYRLELVPPERYMLDRNAYVMYSRQQNWEPREFEMRQGGCNEENFKLINDSSVRGRVFGKDGKVLAKATVQLIPSNSPDSLNVDEVYEAESNSKGEYELRAVPTGSYFLGINLARSPDKNQPYGRTFYPNTSVRESAKVFEIALGQRMSAIDIKLSRRLKPIIVFGQVVFENGRPAADVSVTLEDVNRPAYCVNGCDNRTDSNGYFRLTGYAGFSYFVVAYDSSDEFDKYEQKTISSPPTFKLTKRFDRLKIILVKKPKLNK